MLKNARQARTCFLLSISAILASFAVSFATEGSLAPIVLMVAGIVLMGLATAWYISHPMRRKA